VLALAGSTLVAGCGGIGGFLGSDPVVLNGAKLEAIGDGSAPEIEKRVPVDIGETYLSEAASRAETLLGSVPEPLGPEEIPNGAIREELSETRESALEALDRADGASTPYEELLALGHARRDARNVAAGWEAIDAGLIREDLEDSAAAVHDRIGETRDRHAYVGEDPVRAVLVHREIEDFLQRAEGDATVDWRGFEGTRENPVALGQFAGHVEAAVAARENAAHVFEAFSGSLSERRDLEGRFEEAAESLLGEVETRREDVPTLEDGEEISSLVDGDVEDTPAAWALRRLHGEATDTRDVETERSAGRLASAILLAGEKLAHASAFEALRETVDGGEHFVPETVADVRSIREDAVDAIETARDNGTDSRLTYAALEGMGEWIRFADGELARLGDEVEARHLDYELASYLQVTYVTRSIPAASGTVADALASS
jgi:hypothetical protein